MSDKTRDSLAGHSSGPSTDRYNIPVIDPTSNVLDLVEAAVKRIDDVARVQNDWNRDKIDTESRHIREILSLSSGYEEKLRVAEANRIDAIRAVDVAAVGIAADRAVQQATVLANQLQTNADTLRTLVATTAENMATQLNQLVDPIVERVALLEKSQYEGKGKEQSVVETRQSSSASSGMIFGVIGAFVAVSSLIIAVVLVIVGSGS